MHMGDYNSGTYSSRMLHVHTTSININMVHTACICQASLDGPLSRRPSGLAAEASDLNAPVTINSRQHRTVSALLASLQHTTQRGGERLQRLERVLNTIAADAAQPDKVCILAFSI